MAHKPTEDEVLNAAETVLKGPLWRECPACDGSGWITEDIDCEACEGEGAIKDDEIEAALDTIRLGSEV